MSPTYHAGQRRIANTEGVAAHQLVVDMKDKITLLESDRMALMRFVKEHKKGTAKAVKVEYQTDEIVQDSTGATAGEGAGDTSIAVDDAIFNDYDQILVRTTGELMMVDAGGGGGDPITVTRAVGTVAAAVIPPAEQLLNLGPRFPEGSDSAPSLTTVTDLNVNFTQIFKKSFEISGTLDAISKNGGIYGGDEQKRLMMKAGLKHAHEINHTAYMGNAVADAPGVPRAAGGILERIPAANISNAAALPESQLNLDLERFMRYGSSRKQVFCARRPVSVLNQYVQNATQVPSGQTKFGHNVFSYMSAMGQLDFIVDDTLEGPVFQNYAVVADPEGLEWLSISGRDTQLVVGLEGNGVDGRKDQWLTEGTWTWGEPRTHALWDSISTI